MSEIATWQVRGREIRRRLSRVGEQLGVTVHNLSDSRMTTKATAYAFASAITAVVSAGNRPVLVLGIATVEQRAAGDVRDHTRLSANVGLIEDK